MIVTYGLMGAPETKTEGRRPALSSVCVSSYLLPHDLLQTYLDEVVNCLMLEEYIRRSEMRQHNARY